MARYQVSTVHANANSTRLKRARVPVAADRTVLQNLYSADIFIWLVKFVEQIMNLNQFAINL